MGLRAFLRRPLDPEQATIEDFVRRVASDVKPGAKLLDAGAGDAPYRQWFAHTDYVTVDFAATGYHDFGALDIVADLAALPIGNDAFDAVLCTQVLEHVPDPQRVLTEFARVLKPGGSLYLTIPQSWEIHEAPHDYFRFTRHGIELLLKQAGLQPISIDARGGYFYFLAERVRHFPDYVSSRGFWSRRIPARLLRFIFHRILPRALISMDGLDAVKRETLGYACIARKPLTGNAPD